MTVPGELMTASLRSLPWGQRVARIVRAGLTAAEPRALVRRTIERAGSQLRLPGHTIDLANFERIHIVGTGKAATSMARALRELVSDRDVSGIIVTKHAHDDVPDLEVVEAGHPIPDARGVAAAQKTAAYVSGLGAQDLVLCPISGGGSALWTLPAEGVSLDDIRATTATLLRRGATIEELNRTRQQMERLKGGGLAKLAAPATVVGIVLSDVVSDDLGIVASGPTMVDEGSPTVINVLVGNNGCAVRGACARAAAEGFRIAPMTPPRTGEAREVGRDLAGQLRTMAGNGPACAIVGGETTVTVTGEGTGGRNQELALAAVNALDGAENVALVAFATDGEDGPTTAAGAIVTGATAARARAQGLDAAEYLGRNDSHTFFDRLDDLIVTGPTRTNVCDLMLLFAGAS